MLEECRQLLRLRSESQDTHITFANVGKFGEKVSKNVADLWLPIQLMFKICLLRSTSAFVIMIAVIFINSF